jgi:hypothetical protein
MMEAKTKATAPKNTTRFGKGNPGKPKGAVNHVTKDLKAMILAALDGAGGVEYLQRQADEKPAAFLALVGKVLPMTVQGPGEDGAIVFTVIERKIVRPEH